MTTNENGRQCWIKQLHKSPGKTPANPSAFSINSSTGRAAIEASLSWPSNEEDGYMFVPIPSLRPVSLAMASWSPGYLEIVSQCLSNEIFYTRTHAHKYKDSLPVIILTFTPRLRALLMVSACHAWADQTKATNQQTAMGHLDYPWFSLVLPARIIKWAIKITDFIINKKDVKDRRLNWWPVLQLLKIEAHVQQTYLSQHEPSSWHPPCYCIGLISLLKQKKHIRWKFPP